MNEAVLFISPHRADASLMSCMLDPVCLHVDHATDLAEARSRLRRSRYSAILTEARLRDGCWKDVLDLAYQLPQHCAVVVTDRLADDRFWAEILNLGAYDLLVQPFDTGEVQRIIENACMQARVKPVASVQARTAIPAQL